MATYSEDDYLRLLAEVASTDAAGLLRYYRVGPPTHHTLPRDYDDRLEARVPAAAVADVVAFTYCYCVAFGLRCHSPESVRLVREDMIRAWELSTTRSQGQL